MIILIVYLLLLLTIGVIDFKKVKSFNDYVLAGRKQSLIIVTISLMASMIGSGSTVGLADKTFAKGFPAIWFLAVGGIGLILQSVFLSEKVRASEAVTLPDLAEKTMGNSTRILVAFIITITWIGIIAAQFIAAGKIITALTGLDAFWVLTLAAAVIVLYSYLGGQASILKTDFLQFLILLAAVVFTVIFLYSVKPPEPGTVRIELLNEHFTGRDLFFYLTVVMGSYFICPMMFSRLLTAKTPQTAKKSSFIAGSGVLIFAVLIVLIGLWGKSNIADPGRAGVISWIFINELPKAGGIILILGILSAIISTTDTCLLMTSSIIEHDIIYPLSGRGNEDEIKSGVFLTRILVLVLGILGYLTALWGNWDIIGLLLEAFEFYTAGIVPAMFIALLVINRKNMDPKWSFLAVLTGGIFGIMPKITAVVDMLSSSIPGFWVKSLPVTGMALSLVLAVTAAYKGKDKAAA